MKKLSLILAALMLLGMWGCAEEKPHEHIWESATCTQPAKCADCGETVGEPLGHNWQEATCSSAQKCARCSELYGEPLGHEWVAATCTQPETCALCDLEKGEPLGHSWQAATYTAPKTCTNCQATEGQPLERNSSSQGSQKVPQGNTNTEKPSVTPDDTTQTGDKNKNQEAMEAAYEIAAYYAMVCPRMIKEILMDDYGFTESQAAYAVRNVDIDWNMYAASHLEEYVGMSQSAGYYVTKGDAERYLYIQKGYSDAAIQYAFANVEIDWTINAPDTKEPTESDWDS